MNASLALKKAKDILSKAGISTAGLDAMILLTKTLNCNKEQIIFDADLLLKSAQISDFFSLVNLRAKRIPISHLIGNREFFSLTYKVTSDVLDPRPDSESLIELVFEAFPVADFSNKQNFKILEIGCGSGCLIITLLKYYNLATAIASDISNKALEICQDNAIFHQVASRLELLNSDLFSAIESSIKFDFIISNPPYIASNDIELLEPEVRLYEPRIALDGGKSGLDFYQKIATQARNFLKPNGKILLEIGSNQQDQISEIFNQQKFTLEKTRKDLSGTVRALCFN